MSKILFVLTFLISIICNASYHNKTVVVRANGGTFIIFKSVTYNNENIPVDSVYSFMATEKFPPYTHTAIRKELYYGSLNEVYSFLIDVRDKFATAEHRKEYYIDGMLATYSEQPLITHFIIENCSVQLTLVNKMITRLQRKCRKLNIQLKYVKRNGYCSVFPKNSFTQKVEWHGVRHADTASTRTYLHAMCLQWIADTWSNPKEVLQIDDFENGFMCIVGTTQLHTGSVFNIYEPDQYFRYKINIWMQRGNFKYEIKEIYSVQDNVETPIELDIRDAIAGSRKHQDIVNACYNRLSDIEKTLNKRFQLSKSEQYKW